MVLYGAVWCCMVAPKTCHWIRLYSQYHRTGEEGHEMLAARYARHYWSATGATARPLLDARPRKATSPTRKSRREKKCTVTVVAIEGNSRRISRGLGSHGQQANRAGGTSVWPKRIVPVGCSRGGRLKGSRNVMNGSSPNRLLVNTKASGCECASRDTRLRGMEIVVGVRAGIGIVGAPVSTLSSRLA